MAKWTAASIWRREHVRIRTRLLVLLGGVVGFVGMLVAVQAGATAEFDRASVATFVAWHGGPLDVVMRLASELGSGRGLAFLTALAVGVLIATGRPRGAAFIAVAFVAAEWVSAMLKTAVGRPRPPLELRTALELPGWFDLAAWVAVAGLLLVGAWWTRSRNLALATGLLFLTAPLIEWDFGLRPFAPEHDAFPSGHALRSVALATSIAFVGGIRRRSTSLGIVVAALLFLVGVSRVYLAVHYPSDVLGGWLAGAALVAALSLIPSIGPKHEALAGGSSDELLVRYGLPRPRG